MNGLNSSNGYGKGGGKIGKKRRRFSNARKEGREEGGGGESDCVHYCQESLITDPLGAKKRGKTGERATIVVKGHMAEEKKEKEGKETAIPSSSTLTGEGGKKNCSSLFIGRRRGGMEKKLAAAVSYSGRDKKRGGEDLRIDRNHIRL